MSALSEIIERLEKATGPDRELDHAIALAVGWTKKPWARGAVWTPPSVVRPSMKRRASVPAFTALIENALTLAHVWSWRVGNLPSGRGFADLGTQASLQCVEGATPAIALCIAALKARSA